MHKVKERPGSEKDLPHNWDVPGSIHTHLSLPCFLSVSSLPTIQ